MAITLGELFSKNPRELTREDRLEILRVLRESRSKWAGERQASRTEGRKVKTSKGISSKKLGGIKLDDDFFADIEGDK